MRSCVIGLTGVPPRESGSQSGLLPVPRRLFRRERDLERYLNLWRLAFLGVLLLFLAVVRGAGGRQPSAGSVALPLVVLYFIIAAGLHGVLGWKGWRRWMPAWVVGADLLFIVAVHFAFLLADQPVWATNSQIAFLGYFVVVALAGVRSDPGLAKAVAVAAPISYAAIVFLAVTWRSVDMSLPDPIFGSFRWDVQVVRVVVLAVVTHLVTLDVALGDVDRAAARQDPLTGAFNRRHLEEFLSRQISRSMSLHRPLALLLLDLDGFKEFNDRHGHLAGDRALADVAAGLADRLRSTDLVARYGGDEFVVVLPGATGEEARRVAWDLVGVGGQGLRFSVGISCLSERCRTVADLLGAADQALLRAKRSGGGVRVAGEKG